MSSRRILLVEDTPALAREITDILAMSGYAVSVAPDGKQGLNAALLMRPDLIITDLKMPNMDGLEFIANVRREKGLSRMPVIILSARVTEEDRRKGLDSGANLYLKKPCSIDELLESIADLLKSNSSHE